MRPRSSRRISDDDRRRDILASRSRLERPDQRVAAGHVELSTRAVQQVIPECGHFMQTDKPQVVVDAIEAMLAAIARA